MAGWLPSRVVALRMWLFARINGDEGIPIPGPLVDASRFRQVYSHPAANGRSRGAALSDLFWYWLAPGPEVHQEHLEAGPRYEQVAQTTRRILSIPAAQVEELATRHTAQVCAEIGQRRMVRLRDLMMSVWAGFFAELVFADGASAEARSLIVANADDVVTALKGSRLRHMDRRDRLTQYLDDHLDEVPHVLPAVLSRREQALYLQGTYFNTGVVQLSEAMTHLLMVLAHDQVLQADLATHPDDQTRLHHVMDETMRLYPLFGIAHRITTDEIVVDDDTRLPKGSVLCFNYQAFQQEGFEDPERFDPSRWERLSTKDANYIPYGVAANRPCPAWHMAPIAMRAATREILRRFTLHSSAGHIRSIPNRGPCVLVPRGSPPPRRLRPLLAGLQVRDRAEDVGRSLAQLVFGTYMVRDARRQRLCERHFAEPLFPQPLLDVLARHPDQPAIEHGARVVSCGELLAMVRRVTAGMRAAGLGPGRRVAMHTGVTPEAFAANIAAHVLGCEVAGVRPAWSDVQFASVIANGIETMVGDSSTLTPELLARVGPVRTYSVDDLFATEDDGVPLTVLARPDDIARINFTSGSTGRPKGCAYTYRTYSLLYQPDRRSPELARLMACFERYLVQGNWAMPVMLTFAGRCLLTGGTVVLPDDDPRPALSYAMERHRVTGAVMTPAMLRRMLDALRDDPLDLSCLRAVVITGAPASAGLLAAARDRLGPVIWQGYGQAESGMISLLTPDDIARFGDEALTSVGRPLPDVELSFRESDEICVRGPTVMAGYWCDPEQTAEVLRDGWLHTGDLGDVDDTGLLRLTGRSRDVIIVFGEVCYAGAIERVLAQHPDVDQAYVVGVPDDRTGEAVHAFIVSAHSADAPDHETLAALVRSELTPAHVPETITSLREVPLAASGKPDKHALCLQFAPPGGSAHIGGGWRRERGG